MARDLEKLDISLNNLATGIYDTCRTYEKIVTPQNLSCLNASLDVVFCVFDDAPHTIYFNRNVVNWARDLLYSMERIYRSFRRNKAFVKDDYRKFDRIKQRVRRLTVKREKELSKMLQNQKKLNEKYGIPKAPREPSDQAPLSEAKTQQTDIIKLVKHAKDLLNELDDKSDDELPVGVMPVRSKTEEDIAVGDDAILDYDHIQEILNEFDTLM